MVRVLTYFECQNRHAVQGIHQGAIRKSKRASRCRDRCAGGCRYLTHVLSQHLLEFPSLLVRYRADPVEALAASSLASLHCISDLAYAGRTFSFSCSGASFSRFEEGYRWMVRYSKRWRLDACPAISLSLGCRRLCFFTSNGQNLPISTSIELIQHPPSGTANSPQSNLV